MKRELLAATALGSMAMCHLTSVRAQTANWVGPYAGAFLGYADGSSSGHFLSNGNGLPASTSDFDVDGFNGGAAFGYNWQRDHLVFGVETDFSALSTGGSVNGTLVQAQVPPFQQQTNYLVSGGTDWLYSFRGRLGYAIDRLLIFGTGGLGLGDTHLSTSYSQLSGIAPGKGALGSSQAFGTQDRVRLGYVLGGGVEYALSNHLSVKLEGLYYNLGTGHATGTGTTIILGNPGPFTPYQVNYKFDGGIGRLGVNYRF